MKRVYIEKARKRSCTKEREEKKVLFARSFIRCIITFQLNNNTTTKKEYKKNEKEKASNNNKYKIKYKKLF